MSADQEDRSDDLGGDYGYDLAHEVRAGADAAERPRAAPVPSTAGLPFEPDPHGDLGYDCAHEG